MRLIDRWQSKRSDMNLDLDYDPIVRLIIEVNEQVEAIMKYDENAP